MGLFLILSCLVESFIAQSPLERAFQEATPSFFEDPQEELSDLEEKEAPFLLKRITVKRIPSVDSFNQEDDFLSLTEQSSIEDTPEGQPLVSLTKDDLGIELDGITDDPEALAEALADFIGAEITEETLEQVKLKIYNHLRAWNGASVAVDIPEQELTDGELSVHLLD